MRSRGAPSVSGPVGTACSIAFINAVMSVLNDSWRRLIACRKANDSSWVGELFR